MTKSDHEIGARITNTQPAREFGTNGWHFDRLIDHRVADTEHSCLKCEPLKTAPDAHPVVLVGLVTDEDRDPR